MQPLFNYWTGQPAHLAAPLSQAGQDLLDTAMEGVSHNFKEWGHVKAVMLSVRGPDYQISLHALPPMATEIKDAVTAYFDDLRRHQDAAAFITECWTATFEATSEDAALALQGCARVQPSDRPDREEAVIVHLYDQHTRLVIVSCKILRDDDGNGTLQPWRLYHDNAAPQNEGGLLLGRLAGAQAETN